MTFTTEQMGQARFTTRHVSLDFAEDVTRECGQAIADGFNAPADGLSISEAAMLSDAYRRIGRSVEGLSTLVATLRARQ